MKPLLIGEAPSKNEVTERPIEGRIGKRLASWAGISFEEFLVCFDRINLLHVRQDTKEHGFTFDRSAAGEAARDVMKTIQPGQTVILLGKRVRDAFGVVKDYFEPHHLPNNATIYVVPHPSGINRWHNDPTNASRMNEFMRSLVRG